MGVPSFPKVSEKLEELHEFLNGETPLVRELFDKYPEFKEIESMHLSLLKKTVAEKKAKKRTGEVKQESIDEKVTILDLAKNQGSSPKSMIFKKERNKIMGLETHSSKFIQCSLTKNGAMDFYFLAESTRKYKKGYKRKSANIKNGYRLEPNPSETYQITIRVLDFMAWVNTHPDIKEITPKDIKEILTIANIEIDSEVPAWYWQGGAYNLQRIGGTIYKRFIKKPQKKPNKGWYRDYPKGHGDGHFFIDKITQSIVNSIGFYLNLMAQAATKVLKEAGKI
jgi:hypothetical protein